MLTLADRLARPGNPNASACTCSPIAARLARHARRTHLRFPAHWPHTALSTTVLAPATQLTSTKPQTKGSTIRACGTRQPTR